MQVSRSACVGGRRAALPPWAAGKEPLASRGFLRCWQCPRWGGGQDLERAAAAQGGAPWTGQSPQHTSSPRPGVMARLRPASLTLEAVGPEPRLGTTGDTLDTASDSPHWTPRPSPHLLPGSTRVWAGVWAGISDPAAFPAHRLHLTHPGQKGTKRPSRDRWSQPELRRPGCSHAPRSSRISGLRPRRSRDPAPVGHSVFLRGTNTRPQTHTPKCQTPRRAGPRHRRRELRQESSGKTEMEGRGVCGRVNAGGSRP